MMPQIVLASTSPRRLQLLTEAGLQFITLAPQVDETPKPREGAQAMVLRLARAKARAVAGELAAPAIVIAADTTVVAPGGKKILAKPESKEEAHAMLRSLQGKLHTVFTGYCLFLHDPARAKPIQVARSVKTLVKMRKLSAAQIDAYIATGEPMDKAGAYGAQGVGMGLIEEIRGSYTNVVGLPIAQVLADLQSKFGVSAW